MAFLVEQAGGAATTGRQRILESSRTACTSACRHPRLEERVSVSLAITPPDLLKSQVPNVA